jgi:hypothetical protein
MRLTSTFGLRALSSRIVIFCLALAVAGCADAVTHSAVPAASGPTAVSQSPQPHAAQDGSGHRRGGHRGARDLTQRLLVDAGQTKDWNTILFVPAGQSGTNLWATDCAGDCGLGVTLWNNPSPVGVSDAFTKSGTANQYASDQVYNQNITAGQTAHEQVQACWNGGCTGTNYWEIYSGTQTPGQVTYSPDPLGFTTLNTATTVTFSETNYPAQSFTMVSGPNTSIATVTQSNATQFLVTSKAFGSTSFQVQGDSSQPPATVTVTVAAPTPGPINVTLSDWQPAYVGSTSPLVTVSEANYSGTFTATSANTGLVSVTNVSANNTFKMTKEGPAATSVVVTGAPGQQKTITVESVAVPGLVDVFPNDEIDYPAPGNHLGGCAANQPRDPNQVNPAGWMDPDAAFVPLNQLGFDSHGCETVTANMMTNPVNQINDYSVHIHETNYVGKFSYTTDGNCGNSLNIVGISSVFGPDALLTMHGTSSAGAMVSCVVKVLGYRGNNNVNTVNVVVKLGGSP